MNKVVEILMRRDSMSENEAKELVATTRKMLHECHGDYEEAVDIMQQELGLEPDYIMDII